MYQLNMIGYWREADQLAIYKHDRGVELGSTEKQLQLRGQSGTGIRTQSPSFFESREIWGKNGNS